MTIPDRQTDEVLANTGQRTDLAQLMNLLRETVSDNELKSLCERLSS